MSQSDKQGEALDERTLIARIVAGDRRLFHELVRPYERAVFVTALSVLRDHADAEDAAQETMIKALTHLHQLDDPAKFKGWLLRVALNEARLKRRGRHDGVFESIDNPPESEEGFMPLDFADWRELPSEVVERRDVRNAVAKALQELPEIYREMFILRDVEQLSTAECAEILGLSTAAVKLRLHRARLMLREKLAPAFKKGWLDRLLPFKGRNPW